MKHNQIKAIVIGDSTNNTLSAVRSLGEAQIEQCLILKCEEDTCYVSYSKYLKKENVYQIRSIEECLPILEQLKAKCPKSTLICTFDEAAMLIDEHEALLSTYFITPARGKQIGNLFQKDAQCKLAEQCGLTVPRSCLFHRNDSLTDIGIDYPILLKPLLSTAGEKSDIHICKDINELQTALAEASTCEKFILQEFVEKEYEIDCIGVRTEQGVFLAGGIRKIRHYPQLIGAGAYGIFQPMSAYNINTKGLEKFLEEANYYGPFSVEFLHKGDKDYFMEVNFRNEGLAYAATAAGANLHALYVDSNYQIDKSKIRSVYMMNYSLDYLYVKSGEISFITWLRDFFRTRCFININFRDLNPTIQYYIRKFCH